MASKAPSSAKFIEEKLLAFLDQNRDKKKADWWTNYMKGEIPFYGVGIPDLRKELKRLYAEHDLGSWSAAKQKQLVVRFAKKPVTEEKYIAILFMQLFWVGYETADFILDTVEELLDKKVFFDWNTVDWLCVRVLSPLVDSAPKETVKRLKTWRNADYLWKARASLVPFAQCDSLEQHVPQVLATSNVLIKRDERFAKTAVGWVLRMISKFDATTVRTFLKEHEAHVTTEVRNNALKYLK